MARWGMVIDCKKCIGCGTCQFICGEMNSAPPGAAWRRVIDREIRGQPDIVRIFLPINCMHCSDPPCLDVCPTGATHQRPDGIVDIKEDLCVGCGACVVSCPYRARTITSQDTIKMESGADMGKVKVAATADRIGLSTKCNFCCQRVGEGLAKGFSPGSDPIATPICVNFCIASALHFGDLDDPTSSISQLIRENNMVRLLEELKTKPNLYYMMDSNNTNPDVS